MSKQPVEGQILYSVEQAAAILSVSPRLVWAFIGAGKIRTRRVSRRVLVTRTELERFAARDHETTA